MSIDDFKVPDAERGLVTKHAKYLVTMKTNTLLRLDHPIHHGVPMQAHHALSAKGVLLSGHGGKLEDFGYDINDEENLVYIPSTLQGACLLRIQPHRGDHRAKSGTDLDVDKTRDDTYHELVAIAVRDIYRDLRNVCGSKMHTVKAKTKTAMDKESAEFIKKIQKKPAEYRLTSVSENYKIGNPKGCGGRNSVSDKPLAECPESRNHTGKSGITFVYSKPYILKPGN